jgi:hypothetical protein
MTVDKGKTVFISLYHYKHLLLFTKAWDVSELQPSMCLLFIACTYERGQPWWNDTDRGILKV